MSSGLKISVGTFSLEACSAQHKPHLKVVLSVLALHLQMSTQLVSESIQESFPCLLTCLLKK